jgi:hypothetical protein
MGHHLCELPNVSIDHLMTLQKHQLCAISVRNQFLIKALECGGHAFQDHLLVAQNLQNDSKFVPDIFDLPEQVDLLSDVKESTELLLLLFVITGFTQLPQDLRVFTKLIEQLCLPIRLPMLQYLSDED